MAPPTAIADGGNIPTPSTRTQYRAVCLDLDGTLLNNKKEISERNKEVIRKVAAKGVAIVLASGRMTPCVEPYQVEESGAQQLFETFRARFSAQQAHVIPERFFIEFVHPSVNKGVGVQHLISAIDIPMELVIGFGDGHNDAEMLQMVGLGVAMKNGENTAKRAANRVSTHSNEEDGVARELEEIFGL